MFPVPGEIRVEDRQSEQVVGLSLPLTAPPLLMAGLSIVTLPKRIFPHLVHLNTSGLEGRQRAKKIGRL
jgi:hypothetical protein